VIALCLFIYLYLPLNADRNMLSRKCNGLIGPSSRKLDKMLSI
jgi:hypothetical protein